MQHFELAHFGSGEGKQVLCLGAHSDDIEIGCGGSVLRLIEDHPRLGIWWIVFSGQGLRGTEAQRSAGLFLEGAAQKTVLIEEFKDGYFPYQGAEIKDFFESLKQRLSPDLIFTHCRHDLHQDHRLINELTWNTWRDHQILEYEIPKFDGDLGTPNLYIQLKKEVCQKKSDLLCQVFKTQESKPWFTGDTFWALLKIRGIESRAVDGLAEAFYARKVVL